MYVEKVSGMSTFHLVRLTWSWLYAGDAITVAAKKDKSLLHNLQFLDVHEPENSCIYLLLATAADYTKSCHTTGMIRKLYREFYDLRT